MKLVIQRVSRASVVVGERTVGAIGAGMLVLVGVEEGDGSADADRAAAKVAGLRLFEDDRGRMNRGPADVGAAVLAVSQFTLAGSIDRGRRPSFDGAMDGELARPLFDRLVAGVRDHGIEVETGEFGAMMQVELVNDGPVTFVWSTR